MMRDEVELKPISGVADLHASVMPPPKDTSQLRRMQNNERFVAFAFAGADMMVETDIDGIVTYAAGAFRSKLGRPAEAFVGHDVRDLVAPVDHEVLETALSLLVERGRLQPLLIRLANPARTNLALAGMALPAQGCPLRLCLSLAQPPAPLVRAAGGGTPHSLARRTETRLRTGRPCDLGLLEIKGAGNREMASGEEVSRLLETVAPHAVASEIAPGRFGLLGSGSSEVDLLSVASLLEVALRGQGVEVSVAPRHIPLVKGELSPVQAARALRQALNVFANKGTAGFDEAGFDGGLAGYIQRAGTQAAGLRKIIRGGHFSLAFQPIVSLADRTLHHYEALIRPGTMPDHPVREPQEFVMLVEALGFADELDLVVAQLSCEAASSAGVRVAFNVSGQSMQSGGFRDRLTRLLAGNAACRAGLVMVEMTETAEIEDVAEAVRTAEALRSLGVPFCLDDFGAGANDIRLLRAFTPNIVKLDGSYIPAVTQGGRERGFVAGMIEIARATGAEVVAERVETEDEADALRALGVQYGQGWLFGRPGALPGVQPERSRTATSPRGTARRNGVKESWG